LKPSSQYRIAVVDDDSAVRDSQRLLMESHGFQTDGFDSAVAFLDAGVTHYDCLVVDLHMPEMTGLELAETLRARGIHTPIIVVTGRYDPLLAQRFQAAGVLTILSKPFAHEQLLDWIHLALGT
jgi:FixJ family two-component response regulator